MTIEELDLFHRNKYTRKDDEFLQTEFPKELIRVVYNSCDDLKFNNKIIKGKIEYYFIPARYMLTGKPYCLYVLYNYDGIGNSDLSEDKVMFISFKDLPEIFPHNKIIRKDYFSS